MEFCTSSSSITHSRRTLQKSDSLLRCSSSIGTSDRHTRMSGTMPMPRSAATECWLGFVLISFAARMNGTSVRWMKIASPAGASSLNWRVASWNGRLSMSPVVPPISVMAMSTSSLSSERIADLISSVICGTTCTVPPR